AVLSYSTDGVAWTPIVTLTGAQGARTYGWTVPSINTLTARVRVCDVGNGTNCDGTLPADLFQIDSTAPTVTVNPANNAQNVPIGQPIVLTFSEAMNIGSVQTAFNVNPNPGGIVFTWSGGDTVVTISHQNFALCASPQVTL